MATPSDKNDELTDVEELWDSRPEEDKLNDRIKELKNNVMAFAGQLQAWGCDKCAEETIKEILGNDVNAPDYYTQMNRIEELEEALKEIKDIVELWEMEGTGERQLYDIVVKALRCTV